MSTQATTHKEGNGLVNGALETVGNIGEVGIDMAILKKKLTNAVDDAIVDAERMAKHGRRAIEDTIDDTTYLIKKNPWQSVGYAAGAGLGVGLVAGWLITRRSGR